MLSLARCLSVASTRPSPLASAAPLQWPLLAAWSSQAAAPPSRRPAPKFASESRPSSDRQSRSADRQKTSPDRQSRSSDRSTSRSSGRQSRTSDRRSPSFDRQSDRPTSRPTDRRAPSPDRQSSDRPTTQPFDRQSRTSDRQSRSSDRRSPSSDRQSRTFDRQSQSSYRPTAQPSDRQSRSSDRQSRSSDRQSRSSDRRPASTSTSTDRRLSPSAAPDRRFQSPTAVDRQTTRGDSGATADQPEPSSGVTASRRATRSGFDLEWENLSQAVHLYKLSKPDGHAASSTDRIWYPQQGPAAGASQRSDDKKGDDKKKSDDKIKETTTKKSDVLNTESLLDRLMATDEPPKKPKPYRMTQPNPDPLDVSRSLRRRKSNTDETTTTAEQTTTTTKKKKQQKQQAPVDDDAVMPLPKVVPVAMPDRPPSFVRWENTGLQPVVCRLLTDRLALIKPTPIQLWAIKTILQGRDTLVHAPTGSGKTLAVLLPMLQRLGARLPAKASAHFFGTIPAPRTQRNNDDDDDDDDESGSAEMSLKRKQRRAEARAKGLRALVIVPTLELLDQFAATLEQLLGVAGTAESVRLLNGRYGSAEQQLDEMHAQPRPIVLATPERLLEVLRHDYETYGRANKRMAVNARTLEMVFIDEVDLVMRPPSRYAPLTRKKNYFRHPPAAAEFLRLLREFAAAQQRAIDRQQGRKSTSPASVNPPGMQVVMMSATLAQSIKHGCRRTWMRRLSGDSVTASDPYKEQLLPIAYVRAPGTFAPPSTVRHFYAVVGEDTPTAKVAVLGQILEAKQPEEESSVLVLFEDDNQMRTYTSLIRQLPGVTLSQLRVAQPIRVPGWTHLYLANYRQIRGLHMDDIQHVFLLDPPANESDYLHLAGRTGRLCKDGSTAEGSVVTMASFAQISKLNKFMSNLHIDFHPLHIDSSEESGHRLEE